jgi:hypothetical protein
MRNPLRNRSDKIVFALISTVSLICIGGYLLLIGLPRAGDAQWRYVHAMELASRLGLDEGDKLSNEYLCDSAVCNQQVYFRTRMSSDQLREALLTQKFLLPQDLEVESIPKRAAETIFIRNSLGTRKLGNVSYVSGHIPVYNDGLYAFKPYELGLDGRVFEIGLETSFEPSRIFALVTIDPQRSQYTYLGQPYMDNVLIIDIGRGSKLTTPLKQAP